MAETDINVTCQALTDAFNAGDLEAIANCYTKDCLFVIKGAGVVTGHEKTKEEWSKILKTHDKIEWKHQDRTVSGNDPGDLSCEAGSVSIRLRESKEWEHGVYCCTFMKCDDGKWRFRYDSTIF